MGGPGGHGAPQMVMYDVYIGTHKHGLEVVKEILEGIAYSSIVHIQY